MHDTSSLHRQIVDLIITYEAQLEFSSALHPSNAEEQKGKFLSGENKNPSFNYQTIDVPELSFPEFDVENEIDQLYVDRINHTKAQAALFKAVGDDDVFSEQSRKTFPLQEIPEQKLQVETLQDSSMIGTDEIVEAFQKALDLCALSDWNIEVRSNMSSRLFVNQWAKLIGIREELEVSEAELDGLIRHEIGVHVLRCVNGHKQSEPILHVGTKKGRLFEEGIACYVEDPTGPSRIFLRHHAVMFAQGRCFRDTWKELCRIGVSEEDAWSMALRVKRGLQNAGQSGGFTRDALYAQAFNEMQNYAKTGGKVEPLLSAPVHPDEVNLLMEMGKMKIFNINFQFSNKVQ